MSYGQPSDEQIAANERRKFRSGLAIFGGALLLILSIAFLRLAAAADLIPAWLSDASATILFLSWLGYILFRLKPGHPPPDLEAVEDYARETVDYKQGNARIALLVLLFNLIVQGFIYSNIVSRKHLQGLHLALLDGPFVLMTLISLVILSFGGTDELSRTQRARALQFGFILAVVEMCALLVGAAYQPQWSLRALPLAIASVVILPGVYFLFLDWRSGRG